MVKQAMKSDIFDTMPEAALVEELKFLAHVNFIHFECNFLSRVGNRAAHAMEHMLWLLWVMVASKGRNSSQVLSLKMFL